MIGLQMFVSQLQTRFAGVRCLQGVQVLESDTLFCAGAGGRADQAGRTEGVVQEAEARQKTACGYHGHWHRIPPVTAPNQKNEE
jgi:hypothetical protein